MFIDEIIKQAHSSVKKEWVCDYTGEKIKTGQIIWHIKDGKVARIQSYDDINIEE